MHGRPARRSSLPGAAAGAARRVVPEVWPVPHTALTGVCPNISVTVDYLASVVGLLGAVLKYVCVFVLYCVYGILYLCVFVLK